MKQTIKIPEDCKAEITREGDNIVVEIIPINKEFKVGDWVVNNKKYMLVTGIDKDILCGKIFNSNDMEYLGEGYVYDYLCKQRNSDYFKNRLKTERSLMINDKFELVPWRANSGCEYEYINYMGIIRSANCQIDDNSTLCDFGNYFSEGFITEERLKEYKGTVQKLFNKWRGLKQN